VQLAHSPALLKQRGGAGVQLAHSQALLLHFTPPHLPAAAEVAHRQNPFAPGLHLVYTNFTLIVHTPRYLLGAKQLRCAEVAHQDDLFTPALHLLYS
jgi:hypothetical protein